MAFLIPVNWCISCSHKKSFSRSVLEPVRYSNPIHEVSKQCV